MTSSNKKTEERHIDELQILALKGLAIDMLFNPYKYILHDMSEDCFKISLEEEDYTHQIEQCYKYWKGLDYTSGKLYLLELNPNYKSIVIKKLSEAINFISLWDNENSTRKELRKALIDLLKGTLDFDLGGDDGESWRNDLDKIQQQEVPLLRESIGKQKNDDRPDINWERVIAHWRKTVPYIIQNLKYIQYKNKSEQIINVPQNEKNRKNFNYNSRNKGGRRTRGKLRGRSKRKSRRRKRRKSRRRKNLKKRTKKRRKSRRKKRTRKRCKSRRRRRRL